MTCRRPDSVSPNRTVNVLLEGIQLRKVAWRERGGCANAATGGRCFITVRQEIVSRRWRRLSISPRPGGNLQYWFDFRINQRTGGVDDEKIDRLAQDFLSTSSESLFESDLRQIQHTDVLFLFRHGKYFVNEKPARMVALFVVVLVNRPQILGEEFVESGALDLRWWQHGLQRTAKETSSVEEKMRDSPRRQPFSDLPRAR